MDLRQYQKSDAAKLYGLLVRDSDWTLYTQNGSWNEYVKVLDDSKSLLLVEKDEVIGFIRYRLDGPFGVYIYDLLVDKKHRGHSYGKRLIDAVCLAHPHDDIYVMSDNNVYYQKIGLSTEGIVFRVQSADK